MFINGKWRESSSGERFPTIDPATEEVITTVPRGNSVDIDDAVQAAKAAFENSWGEFSPSERGRILSQLALRIKAHREELARIETLDVGKPLREALGDIDGGVQALEYNAGLADKLQGDTIPLGNEYVDFTWLEPLGVTAHIVPWNFPFALAMRSIAPALAAGCTVVLKPAEETPLSSLLFASIVQEVNLPDGVINVITGFGDEAGAALVKHPDVRGVTFTGSVETGRLILEGISANIKPVVLELGGKNAMIVFADADIDRAVEDALEGAFGNSGQVCSAVSRILLERSIRERFIHQFKSRAARLTIGPGMENPDMGPLVSREHFERVSDYVKEGIKSGALLTLGGKKPPNWQKGYFFEPTIFEHVNPGMEIAQEEIFGPVVVCMEFDGEKEAIQITNNVSYGLVAGIYTQDISRALRVARQLETGSVWINGWYLGGVAAPTGGVKNSGIGRERGQAGIHNYVQIKNVGIKL
ncbi:MAG: aldehyde dehydrogenase family protein [Chloroflexota bacterium]